MIDDPFHRLSAFVDLTPRERAVMGDMVGQGTLFGPGQRIALEGDEVDSLFFLHEGWVLSSIMHRDGSRQVFKVHRDGDMMGMPSLPFRTVVESLVALTPARVSTIPLSRFGTLLAGFPRLGALVLIAAQEERVILMERLAVSGRLSAKHSLAALLLLLFDGRSPSDEQGTTLHIPLTQNQIADVLGLSPVHVNRSILALEAEGLIERGGHQRHAYALPDVPRLRSFVGMPERVRRRDPAWLPDPAP